ncbi:MAG: hypothetical protein KKC75_08535 [Nanoarchaeota archaeon]|nr:hypothetical protein [Nanoarchaeota archaeon]MBU1004470.1 hypothetical protein [Nanoarchaeota archaeon]MBU1945559.1 hypothetical protein [Nanoarchaeota archaeon]
MPIAYSASIVPYLISPNSSINVTQNKFFNFTTGVKCIGGDCGNVTAILDPNAVYNPSLGAPYCETSESPCIAGSELLMSADNATYLNGTPAHEPNSPNTIDGCMDNESIKYKSRQTIENITITDLNGTFFREGDSLEINVGMYCVGNVVGTVISYNNDTQMHNFTYKQFIRCPSGAAFRRLLMNLTLDNIKGNHTIRSSTQFILQGNDTCIVYAYNEQDDLTFYVQGPKGVIPMNSGTPFYTTTQNPVYPENITVVDCLQNMKENQSCNITWSVNATGDINSTWEFFAIAESDDANVASNETEKVEVTIVQETVEEPPVEEPVRFNITLINGWNLISFPLNLTDKLVSAVLSGISYSRIFTYSETWKELAGSNSFNESRAYWINSSASQILTINGTEFNRLNITLTKGWNFIGYPSLNASLLNETLKEVNYSVVYSYNNSVWKSNVKARNESLNALKQFNPGYGYWVKVN